MTRAERRRQQERDAPPAPGKYLAFAGGYIIFGAAYAIGSIADLHTHGVTWLKICAVIGGSMMLTLGALRELVLWRFDVTRHAQLTILRSENQRLQRMTAGRP